MATMGSLKDVPSYVYYIAIAATYLFSVVIYRRYFHPLAKVPGPFLATVSHLYQFYHNSIRKGQLYLEIEKLHERYGPVVRIAPNEIHLSDSENYDKIYHVGTRYTKDGDFYACFGLENAAFQAASNELHRHRRALLNPFFSRKMVLSLEDVVQSSVLKLCQRFEDGLKSRSSVHLHNGFRAISIDVITEYLFGQSFGLLDSPGLGAAFFGTIRGMAPCFWVFLQFPFIVPLSRILPAWAAKILNTHFGDFVQMLEKSRSEILGVKAAIESSNKKPARPTIFHQLLDPEGTDEQGVASVDHLSDESNGIIAAAAETTGNTMSISTYHVLSNEKVHRTLVEELEDAFPDADAELDFVTLEKLPYLTAVIKEGLRVAMAVVGRLPRVVPEPGAHFNGYDIPAGSVVGMSAWLMHRDPTVFADPDRFDPDRWLGDEAAVKRAEKQLVPFGRGTRQCVGMNLAYCELYVAIGTFFRRFGRRHLVVDGTTPYDLRFEDYFSGFHPLSSRLLHVKEA